MGETRKESKFSAVDGFRITDFMDRCEKANLTKINHHDRDKLIRLTSNTLFCRSCFLPIHERHYHNELVTPFVALTEIVSACFLPIAMIPLLLISPVLILYELIVRWISDDNEPRDWKDPAANA